MQGDLISRVHWTIIFIMISIEHIIVDFFELTWNALPFILACWVVLHVLWMTSNHDILQDLFPLCPYNHMDQIYQGKQLDNPSNFYVWSITSTYSKLDCLSFLDSTLMDVISPCGHIFFAFKRLDNWASFITCVVIVGHWDVSYNMQEN